MPRLDRDFIAARTSQFPKLAATLREKDEGSLHLEVATSRKYFEDALDNGRLWEAERFSKFIAQSFANADDALANAMGVSFVEDFALGEITEQRRLAVHERLPKTLRDRIISINARW